MKKYNLFIFEKYNFDSETGTIELHYSFDEEVFFKETFTLDTAKIENSRANTEQFNTALANLHLAGGISYYKAFCPQNIIIKNNQINKKTGLIFGNKFYTNGLGEFFFKNNINPNGLIAFPHEETVFSAAKSLDFKDRILIPIGGGKDSIVTIEKLRDFNSTLISVNDADPIKNTAEVSKKDRIIIKRELSPKNY